MKIFPAVDILGGKCVQLVQGKRESATAYGDPLACATRWLDQGADALHVVNLDGAFGSSGKNAGLIADLIKKTGVEIELGGGIRSVEDAAHWLDTGVSRIIISTLATQKPECIRILADQYGSERVMAGVDAKATRLAVHGWRRPPGTTLTGPPGSRNWGRVFYSTPMWMWKDFSRESGSIRVKRLIDHTRLPVVVRVVYPHVRMLQDLKESGRSGRCSALPCTAEDCAKDALEESQ